MSTRVSPVERIRADIDELFASERDVGDVLEEVARLGVRLLMQTAIEAEVTEFLGRERYAHGDRARPGSRNGHCRPPSRPRPGPSPSSGPSCGAPTRPPPPGCSASACAAPTPWSPASSPASSGALSVRDVEATLAEALGSEATLSKSTVSRVCEAIKTEFDAWKRRDLTEVALEYLFLDGSHSRYHEGARAEPVLAAWGMTTEGRPVLVGPEPGSSESTDAWRCFLDGMVTRGLRAPLLVISDGAPGLIGAVELVFPPQPAPALPHPPGPQRARQGARRAPGRGQGRVLGAVRRHRSRAG